MISLSVGCVTTLQRLRKGPLPLTESGGRQGVGSVHPTVAKRLEDAGLVEYFAGGGEGKKRFVQLTREGRDLKVSDFDLT